MCGVNDTLVKFCGLNDSSDSGSHERWLCDSCTDTHLVSIDYLKRVGLLDKVDRTKRVSMGTAGTGFTTQGQVRVPIKMREHGQKTWHTLELVMQAHDMGDKCLVNIMELQSEGWKVVLERNRSGQAGSFMIAPDGVMFALHLDCNGMPILPTRGAPIATYSKPDSVRVNQALHTMAADAYSTGSDAEWSDSDDENPDSYMAGNDDEDAWVTESDDEEAGFAYVAKAVRKEAAKIREESRAQHRHKSARTRVVVHTPKSWHQLMHAGEEKSVTTALQGNARFNLGGKVKWSNELTDSDLEILEQARKDCTACRLTKVAAPAARKGKAAAMLTVDAAHAYMTATADPAYLKPTPQSPIERMLE
jgi:hypothetical protein